MDSPVRGDEPGDELKQCCQTAHHKLHELSLDCLDRYDMQDAVDSSEGSDCTAAAVARSENGTRTQPLLSRATLRRLELLATHGRYKETLDSLQLYLVKHPSNPELLCIRGGCLAATGNKPLALAAFASALAEDPGYVRALMGCAALYKESGMLTEALDLLERARDAARNPSSTAQGQSSVAEVDEESDVSGCSDGPGVSKMQFYQPGDEKLGSQVCQALAMVLTDLATRSKLSGHKNWKELYERAIATCPTYAPAHYNLGVAAAEIGAEDEALERYGKAVSLEPRYAEAWCNAGVIHRSKGRLQEAIGAYEAALAAAPHMEVIQENLAAALTEHGTALKASGDVAACMRAYERAVAIRPTHAEALYNLGVAHSEAGELDKAIFMYQLAVSAAPHCAEAHNNLGVLHRERGNMESAMRCYEAALSVRPAFPQAMNNLAVIYTQQGRASDALNLLHGALLANPTYAEAHNNLGVLQRDVGDPGAAIKSYERCSELDPGNRNAGQNRLLSLNYLHPGESELVCCAHAAWGQRFEQLHSQDLLPPLSPRDIDRDPNRPLIVGYISPDLFVHSVSYFAEAPLSLHKPQRVRHIVYSVCHQPDAKTARLKSQVLAARGTWRDMARASEKELATAVRADNVDILVELTGHTAHNRLGTLALRPAPVQITWIGYPNSTGLKSIDYRFTDAVCDPVDTQQTFTERLVRLPGCFLCYTPAVDAPKVALPPVLSNGFVTFGSFNALAKQTPEVLRVWAHILREVPTSRLILKNKPFACETVRQRYWAIFEENGIDSSRVDLIPLTASTQDHLDQYSLMDVALDPWPYAGTTTTAEALYMGVPCLTLTGRCHAHNVGASLLTAVGLAPEWVAQSVDEYVEKARELTMDVDALAALRAGMRERVLRSPLCDAPVFVERLEDMYRKLWRDWVDGVM